jgi:drug/metabolite transporter (DMT)-like permease
MSADKIGGQWSTTSSFVALGAFALLSGLRDVAIKYLFDHTPNITGTAVSTISIVGTWVLFYIIISSTLKRPYKFHDVRFIAHSDKVRLVYLNIGTIVVVYGTYFAVKNLNAYISTLFDSSLIPLVTAILASILRKEKMSPIAWAAMLISLLAVSASVIKFNVSNFEHLFAGSSMLGVLGGLLACIAFALNQVWNKELVSRGVVGERLITLRFTLAALVMLFIGASSVLSLNINAICSIVLIAILGVSLPMYLLVRLLEKLDVKHVAIVMYVIPVVSLVGSILSGQIGYNQIAIDIAVCAVILGCVFVGEKYA